MGIADPVVPVVFLKPETALLRRNRPFYIPDFTRQAHYEVGLLVCISRLGKHIASRFAHRYYDQVGLGVDFTARDLQESLRASGHPWELSKAFDASTAVSSFIPLSQAGEIGNITFRLELNGRTVQRGNTAEMIFPVDELIAYVSRFFTLKTGDILFTGTPAGVGKVSVGDRLRGYIGEEKMLDFGIK